MNKAHNCIRLLMSTLDPDNDKTAWSFMNEVLMAVSETAELNPTQENLLEVQLSRVKCGLYGEMNNFTRDQFVLQIATWVNGAHVANVSRAGWAPR